MLFYGDASRTEAPAAKLERIREGLTAAEDASSWIEAHGRLVEALIEAGELTQGVADAGFELRGGIDGPSESDKASTRLVVALALQVNASWTSGLRPSLAALVPLLDAVAGQSLPPAITVRQPEGFAHYALYPEGYAAAAAGLAGTDLRVVGIRSIGTTLSAMVAAAAGAALPLTVRPIGHPFARELALTDELARLLDCGPTAACAIVDEGPGLSGSSVAAVAKQLAATGTPTTRINLFPSHANGPGIQASPETRAFWESAPTRLVTFDDLVLRSPHPRQRLESWVADLVGEPTAPMREISGGAWRRELCPDGTTWPPAHPWQERRKFLLETASGTWLLRFAGLGRAGRAKLERAQQLATAGFSPAFVGYRHGFLVERWHGDARPLTLGDLPAVSARIGAYLAYRAREFRATPEQGASLGRLLEMARFNVGQALGPSAARRLDRWEARLNHLAARTGPPVATDNRLHVWEWLLLANGHVVKTDALDHASGHDLVGCQDIAWDVAGATVEWSLTSTEGDRLAADVRAHSGAAVDPELLSFMLACYPAFQLGHYSLAASAARDSAEHERLLAAVLRYEAALSLFL